MPTIVRSNAPKVTSSGDVLLLRSPCATPEIPRSRNSSKVEPNDSGSSRNARKRIFQNASASASVNMRTSIFLYPPFCEIGRTLPFLVCVEVCYLFYITWVGVVAYSPGGSSFPGLHDPMSKIREVICLKDGL